MGSKQCPSCKQEVDDSYSFCPYCGRWKGISTEEMKFKNMEEIENALIENAEKYKKRMEKHEELLDLVETKNKDFFEFQREFTEKFLNRFPQIKDRIKEKEDIKFYLFVITIPYMKNEIEYQHECILQKLAEKQNGIVNLSLNIEEISSNFYSIELPIWTDDFSEGNINKQYEMLKREIPSSQKSFIHSIEPRYFLNRVYEFDGKWIDWKTVFEIPPDKLKRFISEKREVPVNFQNFISLRYSNIISTAGTASDGEAILGIIEEDEHEFFSRKYEEMRNLYYEGSPPGLELIEISWDILKELGFLYKSVNRILRSDKHVFSKTLADLVMNLSEEELARFTQSVNFRRKLDEKTLNETMADSLLDRIYRKYGSGTIGIHEPIQRMKRDQYRISGGAI